MDPTECKRQAQQLLRLGQYAQAYTACAAGAQTIDNPHRRAAEYQDIMDEVCMHAAASSSLLGMSGRVLLVHAPSAEDAWLGLPPASGMTAAATRTGDHYTPGKALVLPGWMPCSRPSYTTTSGPLATQLLLTEVQHFQSLAAAVEAACDGDVVLVLSGAHVVSQASIIITKRILIQGFGPQGSVVLDHRANWPLFKIRRCCVIKDLEVDMVGFREALLVDGPASLKAVLDGCTISCSGDNALEVMEAAQPLLNNCKLMARKAGLVVAGRAKATVRHSTISGCGEQGCIIVGQAVAVLEDSTISSCQGDGAAALEASILELYRTTIAGCAGAAVTAHHNSTVRMRDSELHTCTGGVFLWNAAVCEAVQSSIDGGSSYAVLLDAEAFSSGSGCTVVGPCHISEPLSARELSEGVDKVAAVAAAAATSSSSCAWYAKGCEESEMCTETVKDTSPSGPYLSCSSHSCDTDIIASCEGRLEAASGMDLDGPDEDTMSDMPAPVRLPAVNTRPCCKQPSNMVCLALYSNDLVTNTEQAAALFPAEVGPFAAPICGF